MMRASAQVEASLCGCPERERADLGSPRHDTTMVEPSVARPTAAPKTNQAVAASEGLACTIGTGAVA